jgi:hypothetical protein
MYVQSEIYATIFRFSVSYITFFQLTQEKYHQRNTNIFVVFVTLTMPD